MNEWYLSDGTVLTGQKRTEYLKRKLKMYDDLSKNIAAVLKECSQLNKINYSDSLADSILDAGDKISMIEIELEMLLEEIHMRLY